MRFSCFLVHQLALLLKLPLSDLHKMLFDACEHGLVTPPNSEQAFSKPSPLDLKKPALQALFAAAQKSEHVPVTP